jgi:hypothetical protein
MAARGVLGPVWLPPGSEEERLRITELPAIDSRPYDRRRCLGRYWADGDAWSRISPLSATPRFPTGLPRWRE